MTVLFGILLIIGGVLQLFWASKAFQVYRNQAAHMTSPQISAFGYLYAFFIGAVVLLIGLGVLFDML